MTIMESEAESPVKKNPQQALLLHLFHTISKSHI